MSDTPETNAAAIDALSIQADGYSRSVLRVVKIDVARRLERGRNKARREAEIERDRTCHPDHGGHLFDWEKSHE